MLKNCNIQGADSKYEDAPFSHNSPTKYTFILTILSAPSANLPDRFSP